PPSDMFEINQGHMTPEQKQAFRVVEDLKWSTRSGLTIELSGPADNRTVDLYTYEKSGEKFARDANGNLKKINLSLPEGERFWSIEPYSASGSGDSATVSSGLYDRRQGNSESNAEDGRISL